MIYYSVLIHFTYYDIGIQIQKEGIVPEPKKVMYNKEMVWMYLNNEKQIEEKWSIIKSKGDRKIIIHMLLSKT